MADLREPRPPDQHGSDDRREAVATVGVAGWTMVSRATGLLRVIAVGAALGPTFFANVFSATNTVPNMTYNLMAGSLLVAVVVPSLVVALERGGAPEVRRLAGGLLGVVMTGFCIAGVLVLGAGPLLVRLLTVGVDDAGIGGEVRRQAWLLLVLVVPQVVLYGVATVGVAAQHARSRFALAAAAPAVENVGLVLTLLLVAHRYGTGLDGGEVSQQQVVLLGLGSTLSVAAHAGLQLLGARLAGVPLRPRWGWSDPEVRAVVRRIVPAVGTAMLDAGWFFAVIVAAGTVPGGVVAIQIGLNFYNLPLALSSRSIGTVLLPRLSREVVRDRWEAFGAVYLRALSRSWFVVVPAAVGLVGLAGPLADGLAFGALDRAGGAQLVAGAVAALALALPAAATYEVARQASFARLDARAPLVAGALQVTAVLAGVVLAVAVTDGAATMVGLGLAVAGGDLVRSALLHRSAMRDVPRARSSEHRALARHVCAAGAAVVPSALVAHLVGRAAAGRAGTFAGIAVAAGLGMAGYVAIQSRLRAPELAGLFPLRLRSQVAA